MKKLILMALMTVMIACFFAFAVSAAEIPEWGEITVVDGMADKSVFGADGTVGATSRVLMSDGVTYPAYYICKNSASVGISFTDLNKATGKSYEAVNVVRIELPMGTTSTPMAVFKTENGYTALKTVSFPEGFTTLGSYTFKATDKVTSALVSVDLPSTLTSIEQFAFTYCNSLESLVIPEGITVIPNSMANYTTSLKTLVLPSTIITISESAFRSADLSDGVVIPEGCTTIGSYAFKACGAKEVVIPSTIEKLGNDIFRECASLVTVYCNSPIIAHQMFYDCDELQKVYLENTVTIDNYAFCNPNGGLSKIDTLNLPEGLTSIGTYAFTRSSLEELVLPSTLTTIGASAFIGSKTLTRLVVLGPILGESMFDGCSAVNELVLTEKFVTLSKNALANVSQTSFITYYTGADYERIKSVCSGTTRLSQGKYYTYEDYINENYTYNKFMVIYDVNLCVAAFEGVHTEPKDDGDCTTAVICSMCKEHTFKAAKEHNNSERITYVSFMESGSYYVGCVNDGCECGVTSVAEALFTYLGYSAPENGNGEIAIGYLVSGKAIEQYARVTGKSLNYGLFLVSESKLGNNEIFGENGAANGVISVDMSKHAYDVFELRVFGFTDENKDAKIAMGAYVAESDEEGTEYSYLQSSAPTEGEKYCFLSYNEMVGNISK